MDKYNNEKNSLVDDYVQLFSKALRLVFLYDRFADNCQNTHVDWAYWIFCHVRLNYVD